MVAPQKTEGDNNAMKKIEILVGGGGTLLAIEVNREWLDSENHAPLEKIVENIEKLLKTDGAFNGILGVTAWGKVSNNNEKEAKSLEEVVKFKTVSLQEPDANNSDHHFTDKIRPLLALLLWHKSEHFQNKTPRFYSCVVCGKETPGISEERYPEWDCRPLLPPKTCKNERCYSHVLNKMFMTE